jgi:hypothetical protein
MQLTQGLREARDEDPSVHGFEVVVAEVEHLESWPFASPQILGA